MALVRYPHGGTFEIPVLTVNNKQAEGRRVLGNTPADAIGINKKVADRLSGADFDGDTVMVIPCNRYIALPMTATQFFEEKKSPGSKEQITAELVYYWMIVLNIPFECQKWHLNKLLTLIRVCDIKSRPPKKHSRREIMKRNAALNAARKKKWNTKG